MHIKYFTVFYNKNVWCSNLLNILGVNKNQSNTLNRLILMKHNALIHWTYLFRLQKQAGVYLLATNGMIPPQSIEHMETSCPLYETGKVIHPFAYRVHTHELGMFVSPNHSLLVIVDVWYPYPYFFSIKLLNKSFLLILQCTYLYLVILEHLLNLNSMCEH